jgi:hypothetical protein
MSPKSVLLMPAAGANGGAEELEEELTDIGGADPMRQGSPVFDFNRFSVFCTRVKTLHDGCYGFKFNKKKFTKTLNLLSRYPHSAHTLQACNNQRDTGIILNFVACCQPVFLISLEAMQG